MAFSQFDKEISSVRIKESNSSLEIKYDAKGIKKGDSLKIEIKSKANPNIVYPKSLTGDFGKNLSSGKDKTINWDMVFADTKYEKPRYMPNLCIFGVLF